MRPAGGTVLALIAAGLFSLGVILQATVGLRGPIERTLRLSLPALLTASRRRLPGTASTCAGRGMQGERWAARGALRVAAFVAAPAVTLAGMFALGASPGVARPARAAFCGEPRPGSDADRRRVRST